MLKRLKEFFKKKCKYCKKTKEVYCTCIKCDDARNTESRQVGYYQGLRDGYKKAIKDGNVKFSPGLIKQLLTLCHPNKHNNSVLANEATKWLLAERSARTK